MRNGRAGAVADYALDTPGGLRYGDATERKKKD
jgi:hypothetical protein